MESLFGTEPIYLWLRNQNTNQYNAGTVSDKDRPTILFLAELCISVSAGCEAVPPWPSPLLYIRFWARIR